MSEELTYDLTEYDQFGYGPDIGDYIYITDEEIANVTKKHMPNVLANSLAYEVMYYKRPDFLEEYHSALNYMTEEEANRIIITTLFRGIDGAVREFETNRKGAK